MTHGPLVIHVLDASAVVDMLVRSRAGEQVRHALARAGDTRLVTVAHMDAEVFSALSRLHRAGDLAVGEVGAMLARLGRLPAQRLPVTPALLAAAWDERHNVPARDALYVAAARHLDGRLVTTDRQLARTVSKMALELGG